MRFSAVSLSHFRLAKCAGRLVAAAVLASAVALACSDAQAQTTEGYLARTWTTADGLPTNNVSAVAQTPDGYLWIGTFDGLVRFDGVRFETYTTLTTPELVSNRISGLDVTPDGTLWIGTLEPASVVAFSNGAFMPVSGVGAGLLHDVSLSRGIAYLRMTEGRVIRRDVETGAQDTLPIAGFRAVSVDTSGAVWAAGSHGIFRIDGELTRFAPRLENAYGVLADSAGTLWIATREGLWSYADHRLVLAPTANDWGLRPGLAADSPLRLVDIRASASGSVWMLPTSEYERATMAPGYRLREGTIERPTPSSERDAEAGAPWHYNWKTLYHGTRIVHQSDVRITGMRVDREGTAWVSTDGGGLVQIRRPVLTALGPEQGVPNRAVSLMEDSEGAVWVGSSSFNQTLVRILDDTVVSVDQPLSAWWLYQDRAGTVWSGHHTDGLTSYAPPSGLRAPSQTAYVDSLQGVFEDEGGRTWRVLRSAVDVEGPDGRFRIGASDGIPRASGDRESSVQAIYQAAGSVWIVTNGGGLLRFTDRAGGEYDVTPLTQEHGLSSNSVRGFYADGDSVLWVGTYGAGLNRVDLGSRDAASGRYDVRVLTTADGLFDNVIHAIVEDDAGRFWMSSNRGIFWVWKRDLDALSAGRADRVFSTAYDERDGMADREANGGSYRPALRDRRGRIWFATQGGAVWVDPSRLARAEPMNAVIEDVVVGTGSETHGASATVLLAGPRELRLGPDQRSFEVRYTTCSFVSPERLRFRYRLVGYDDAWQQTERRSAFFTRVPPGDYVFETAVYSGRGWSEAAQLRLSLEPRFYETGWFRLLVGLVVLLLLGMGYRYRLAQVSRRARALEQAVAERTDELRRANDKAREQADRLVEMDRQRARLFTNVSHEFRTPLTLTIGPLEDAQRNPDLPPEARNQVALALRNSRGLLRLTTQLLDAARLDAGAFRLRLAPVDLSALARRCCAPFEALAQRRGLHLDCHLPDTALFADADAEKLEQILVNLLSNAVKFTPAGGEITLTLAADPDDATARFVVRDTGPGIAADALQHLFDRFYQADDDGSGVQPGSGLGLSLAYDLARLHGGTLSAESVEGEGAAFSLTLPLIATLAEFADATTPETAPSPIGAATDADPSAPADVLTDALEDDESAERPLVLLADDHDGIRAYVRGHLEAEYRVIEATDGGRALNLARLHLPDVIVSDVMMPVLSGLGLLAALRASPSTDFVPVVLLTARATSEDRLEGVQSGADAYLPKPFDPDELRACVANLIASRRRMSAHLAADFAPSNDSAPVEKAGPSPPSPASAFLRRVDAVVQGRLSDESFGVDALASELTLSRSTLHRRFREETDTTPAAFLRQARLSRAERMLSSGAGTVADVAYAVGFKSVSHFSQTFKGVYGITPSSYDMSTAR